MRPPCSHHPYLLGAETSADILDLRLAATASARLRTFPGSRLALFFVYGQSHRRWPVHVIECASSRYYSTDARGCQYVTTSREHEAELIGLEVGPRYERTNEFIPKDTHCPCIKWEWMGCSDARLDSPRQDPSCRCRRTAARSA